ncbi:MAG TPA: hypothetical protein VD913_05925, partial [bacterium]|nr:hypothetical protein [bacterium]
QIELYKKNHLFRLASIKDPTKRRFIELMDAIWLTRIEGSYSVTIDTQLAVAELLELNLASDLPQYAVIQEIGYDPTTDSIEITVSGTKRRIKDFEDLRPILEQANIRVKTLGRNPKTGQTLMEFSYQLAYKPTGRMAREYDRDLRKIVQSIGYVLHHRPYFISRAEVRNQQQTEKIPAREIESDRHSMMRGHLAGHVFEILSNYQLTGDVVLDTGRQSLIMESQAAKGKVREYTLDDSFYQRLYPYFDKMGVREIRISQEIISGWLTDSHPSKRNAIYELAAVLKASLTWKEGGLHRLRPLAGSPWGLAGYQHPSGKGIQIRVEKEEAIEDLELRAPARGEAQKIVQLSQNNDIRIPIPDTVTNYVFQIGLSRKRIQDGEVDEKKAVGRHAFIFQAPDNFVFYSEKEWNELVEKGFPEELVRQKKEILAKKKRGNIWLAKMPLNGPPLVVYDAHSAGKDVLYIELIRINDEENQLTLRISGPSKFIKGIEEVAAVLYHFDRRAEVRAGKPLTDVQMADLHKALDEGIRYVLESFPGGILSDEKTRRIVRISSDGSIWHLEINRADGIERLLEMADMGYAILKALMKRPDINIRHIELEYDEKTEDMTYEKQVEEIRNLVIDFFRREAEGVKVHAALLSEENKYSLAEYNESAVRRRFVLKRSKTKIDLSHVMDVQ